MSSPLTFHGVENQSVVFDRPYLNEERQMSFLYCNAFTNFPLASFFLDEESNYLVIKEEGKKRKVCIRLDGNEEFAKKVQLEKEEILSLLRDYTKRLQTGKEIVIVRETGLQDFPYYFTTETIEKQGHRSSKFFTGFFYFINQQLKECGDGFDMSNFDETQLRLGQMYDRDSVHIKAKEKNGMKDVSITFGTFRSKLKKRV